MDTHPMVRPVWRLPERSERKELAFSSPLLYKAPVSNAKVAELADAQDSGSCVPWDVGVRLPPFAHPHPRMGFFFI